MVDEAQQLDWNPITLGVAIPSYNGTDMAAGPLLDATTCPLIKTPIQYQKFALSLLPLAHNLAWCWAMNSHNRGGLTHLLIMHSDVRPTMPHWAELLVTEMQKSKADALGCFIAIKDGTGLTSTAFDTDEWNPQRITLTQAKYLPVTWTAPDLLLNTGLLLINLASFKGKRIVFQTEDDIIEEDGELKPRCKPEDWGFSRQCHQLGLHLFVTRAISIHHSGSATFVNAPAHGSPVDVDSVLDSQPHCITNAFGERHLFDSSNPMPQHAAISL